MKVAYRQQKKTAFSGVFWSSVIVWHYRSHYIGHVCSHRFPSFQLFDATLSTHTRSNKDCVYWVNRRFTCFCLSAVAFICRFSLILALSVRCHFYRCFHFLGILMMDSHIFFFFSRFVLVRKRCVFYRYGKSCTRHAWRWSCCAIYIYWLLLCYSK